VNAVAAIDHEADEKTHAKIGFGNFAGLRALSKPIRRGASIRPLFVPREFARGVLSCYLLSNEKYPISREAEKSATRLIPFGRLEIHTAVALTAVRSARINGTRR
jgi:hypothetical protein